MRATVSDVGAGTYTIKTEGGTEATVPRKLCYKSDGGGAQANNLMLVELNEPSLLQNLRARFAELRGVCSGSKAELKQSASH